MRLDPVEGREQGRNRPALILSHDAFNHGPGQRVVAVPLTTRHVSEFDLFRVEIRPPDGGLREISYAMPDQIRTLSTSRLISHAGRVSRNTLADVGDRVKVLLDL